MLDLKKDTSVCGWYWFECVDACVLCTSIETTGITKSIIQELFQTREQDKYYLIVSQIKCLGDNMSSKLESPCRGSF